MAVLIDEPRWWFRGRRWSHLVSDESLDELHEFAARAGIPRRGFQGDHCDELLELGARLVESRELVRRLRAAGLRLSPAQRRGTANPPAPGRAGTPAHVPASPRLRVHLDCAGTGAPLVFLHGIGASSSTWDRVRELLSPRYRVCAFDLLGHGRSPVPEEPAEYTRDRALGDVDDILASLGEPAVLVGHSLGGYLALAHAATRPGAARAIVVLNTGPGFRDPDKREQWNERSRRNAHRFGVPPQAAEMNLQYDSVVMDRVAELATPTLVLAGDADRPEYTGAGQYLASKMPNARFVAVEGGGHAMHEKTHAGQIADLIDDFVRTLG
jgi:pimeloyl-ACP methyl ester carboxylesterase